LNPFSLHGPLYAGFVVSGGRGRVA
jgi:hypothetical protein